VIASKEVDLKRVLDLTDKSTLEKLGLHEGDLILKKEKLANAYDIPQQIGNIAQEMGFEGILVESAALDDGYNLVIFPKRQ
jgi:hypothetical protein